MQIPTVKISAQYTNHAPSKVTSFKHREDYFDIPLKERDTFCFSNENIGKIIHSENKRLEKVNFKKPVHISTALDNILQNDYLCEKLLCRFHNQTQLESFKKDLKDVDTLKKIKVKNLFGIGAFALAFETTDGKILKIIHNEHFPYNREAAFFDLPILKHGKSGDTYFYLEEKVSQDNISQEELRAFVKKIKDHGYKMQDYLLHFTPEEQSDNTIRVCQFGKTKDGKLYLIDPGCAVAPPKHFFDVKTIKNRLKEKLFKKPST